MSIKKVKIFTDGSCLGNPGPGGYCALIQYKKIEKKICSGFYLTTNNRMELLAAIIGLETLTEFCDVTLVTDSKYVKLGITIWIKKWKLNSWNNSKNKKIKNIDLWKRLEKILQLHKIKWKWIKGHSNIKENEYCDKLAKKHAMNPKFIDIGYFKNNKIIIQNF